VKRWKKTRKRTRACTDDKVEQVLNRNLEGNFFHELCKYDKLHNPTDAATTNSVISPVFSQ